MGILLCTGVFLCLLPAGLDVSATLTPSHSHYPAQGANEGYLAVLQEKVEDKDESSVNTDLLSEPLLVVYFGVIAGWLLANGRGQRAFRFVGLDQGPSFVSAFEDRSFLRMFRL
jgi:hypothetical protein